MKKGLRHFENRQLTSTEYKTTLTKNMTDNTWKHTIIWLHRLLRNTWTIDVEQWHASSSTQLLHCRRAINHPPNITQASRSYHTHKSKGITKGTKFVQVRKSIHCYLAQYQYLGKSSSCCYTCPQQKSYMISNNFKCSSTIIDYPGTCLMSTSVVSPIIDAIRLISVFVKLNRYKQWIEHTIVLFPLGISCTINIFQDRITVINTHRRKLIFCWCWRSKRSRATSMIRYNVVLY